MIVASAWCDDVRDTKIGAQQKTDTLSKSLQGPESLLDAIFWSFVERGFCVWSRRSLPEATRSERLCVPVDQKTRFFK